jgi:3-methyladenine DNA glycosylase AlkD
LRYTTTASREISDEPYLFEVKNYLRVKSYLFNLCSFCVSSLTQQHMTTMAQPRPSTLTTAADIIATLSAMASEQQRTVLMRFFKTAPGEYGAGDQFLGLKVPQTRMVVREAGEVPPGEVQLLIDSPWHEVRLCGFLLLVRRMQRAVKHDDAAERDAIIRFYLRNARRANNWDLVDLSAPYLLGVWLQFPTAEGTLPDRALLDRLTESDDLWEQRIAIVSTLGLLRAGQYADTLRVAQLLLGHPHDLIHKAVGWMLREVGKRDKALLESFLATHLCLMPRTTLRYAIERFPEGERLRWLQTNRARP